MLPKNEKTFHINVVGEITQERYEGDFTCICVPFAALRNKISRDEIRESGDLDNITNELFTRARWLVNAQNRIMTAPDWWNATGQGTRLLDDNVLQAIYDGCIEAEIEWRTNVKNKAAEAATSASPATPQA